MNQEDVNQVIITSNFEFQGEDIIQINDNGIWSDLGTIRDSKQAAIDYYLNNGKVIGKPARVVRRNK